MFNLEKTKIKTNCNDRNQSDLRLNSRQSSELSPDFRYVISKNGLMNDKTFNINPDHMEKKARKREKRRSKYD